MSGVSHTAIGFYLASATSVVNVLMDVCRKKALRQNDVLGTTFWMRVVAGLVFATLFAWHWQHASAPLVRDSGAVFGELGPSWPPVAKFLLYLIFDAGLVSVAILLYLSALSESDLSVCVPFLSFTPVLLIPTGYLFLHEIPNVRQMLGVVLVVCGSLVMNRRELRAGVLGPVKAIFRNKGSRYTLLVAVILAVTNPVDKIIVLMSDSITYAFSYGALLCLLYAGLMAWHKKAWTVALRAAPQWIFLAGLMDASVLLLQFTSHRYIDVFVTITVKRAGVLLSVFAGWLFFRERQIKERLIASMIMLGGVVLIYTPMNRIEEATTFVFLLALSGALWRTGRPRAKAVGVAPGEMHRSLRTGVGERVVRCAIVGCGEISWEYLPVYRDLDWVEVVACVDIVEERAARAARLVDEGQTGRARVCTGLEEALRDDVDLIMISTPNHLHREHAIAGMRAGKQVFLQKPIASTVEEAAQMVEVAAECGVTAGVYMSYFDQPVLHDVRNFVRLGCIGEVTQAHVRVMHTGGLAWSKQAAEGRPSWRGSLECTGGGAFIQLAVHAIRMLTWILGDEVRTVQGFASNRLCRGLEGEDSAVAVLEFRSGVYATLNISWCADGEELAIHGTKGYAVYQDNRWLRVFGQSAHHGHAVAYGAKGEEVFECVRPPLGWALGPFNQHRIFLEAVRDGGLPFATLEDGLQDLRVVAAFYEAVRTGHRVTVEGPAERVEACGAIGRP